MRGGGTNFQFKGFLEISLGTIFHGGIEAATPTNGVPFHISSPVLHVFNYPFDPRFNSSIIPKPSSPFTAIPHPFLIAVPVPHQSRSTS